MQSDRLHHRACLQAYEVAVTETKPSFSVTFHQLNFTHLIKVGHGLLIPKPELGDDGP